MIPACLTSSTSQAAPRDKDSHKDCSRLTMMGMIRMMLMMRMAITITTFTVVQMIPTKKLQASIIVTVLTTAIMIAMTEKNTENTDFNIHIFIQLYTYLKNSNNDNDYKSNKKNETDNVWS